MTLVEYCMTLEDPSEIRANIAAYLGSTPCVAMFASEFIQRKQHNAKRIAKQPGKKKSGRN
jgi:hypothetical protein